MDRTSSDYVELDRTRSKVCGVICMNCYFIPLKLKLLFPIFEVRC